MWQPGDPAERIPFSMTVLKSSAMSEGAATTNLMLQRLQSALTHEIKKMTSIKRAQGELGLGRARKVGLGEPPLHGFLSSTDSGKRSFLLRGPCGGASTSARGVEPHAIGF